LPSFPGYVYAHTDDTLSVNLFVESRGTVEIGKNSVNVTQQTDYPWDGSVKITIEPETEAEFAVHIRIPGWARNKPVPSDLYSFLNPSKEKITLKVNSEALELDMDKGFARIRRRWEKGDVVELTLLMPVQKIIPNNMVEEDLGKIALQRGPLVYCLEEADNKSGVLNRHLPDDLEFEVEFKPDLLGGINILKSEPTKELPGLVAIPYYAWSHRGIGEMTVWISREKILP
jgi:DUF1680 family protein